MKKYSRSELRKLLNECNVNMICEEFYDAIDFSGLNLFHSGDKFIMNQLKKKLEAYKKNSMHASIVIIHKDIPMLVIHKNKPNPNTELHSIYQIQLPHQGENINQVNYMIYSFSTILDILSIDDSKKEVGMIRFFNFNI